MKRTLQIALPFVFVLMGIITVVVMRSMVGAADKGDETAKPVTVEVVEAAPSTHRATIQATGTVQASSRVDVVAQVAGKITWVAPGLTPGARFDAGDVLARIDARDYQAGVVQAQANVQAREVELTLEQSRGRQAKREAELLGGNPSSALTRREPQLAAAEANLASAEATLDIAQANLSRTRLVAPFRATVSSENLEIGQYVAPGAPAATLLGIDRFRVRVSVPVHKLTWLQTPAQGIEPSRAIVHQQLGDGGVLMTEGFVQRVLDELDDQTRSGGVLVAIDDPLATAEGGMPILPGAYVDVTLEGREVADVIEVPRVAVVDGDAVFVADAENRLARKPVTIAWGTDANVYVTQGLTAGDRLVVTPIALPVEGMPLDVQNTVAEAR